jgi:uncharacterized repeat protein (TIGR04052 family)
MPTKIEFAAQHRGHSLTCEARADAPALTDLRFFIHDVELRMLDGNWQELRLGSDGNWQQSGLAMIDLENGEGSCLNGTAVMNTAVTGTIPDADYRGLRFVLGVPFDDNHSDPLAASAPLDDSAMHWHWRSGYKFLRAGIATETDGFWIHLGSTGCEGTVGNIIELNDFVPGEDAVVFDFSALLDGTDLDDREPNDCSSSPSEASCEAPFVALGLDFGSTRAVTAQRVFKLGPR